MNFTDVAVLCLGDVMLDSFIHGEIERISPEAPVPVIRTTSTREMLGGAGNVASNIAALGGRAILVGLLGADEAGNRVRIMVEERNGLEPGFVASPLRPTIRKTRFIAGRQQVVRADDESRLPLQPAEEAALRDAALTRLPEVRAVVLSDYGKGVLSPGIVAPVIEAARAAGIPVFVDPKTNDFSRYRGATCITPNLKELALASGMPVDDEAPVVAASRHVMAQADSVAILATRSEKGMILVERNGEFHSVPTRAREVFDVSGAGDTVIATLALAHASGLSLVQAMHVANAAAGVVVSKLGTATVDMEEVLRELNAQDRQAQDTTEGLVPVGRMETLVARWKAQGLTVGFTNGCFDILHPGHVSLLAYARSQCDRLIVALNTDESVVRLKGPTRPINTLESRAQVIAAVRHVDGVVAFGEDTPLELIRRLVPDVLIKGADYSIDRVVGADVVQGAGGRVVLAELVPGQSTTAIVGRMRAPTLTA
ncbi:MAG TPA: D-glycero-beta-D-manno-heptose-7-phosphate kinase [Acetobacteraceae bacterium]|nr:D-glycero-beta-D-manno-heptose-7-phosphate kinase [Acetobacteraceae bacterium]